jgi:hypothetical protein
MAAFSNQIHDGPVVFATLEEIKGQFRELPTTQSTAQQNGENCSIAFAFQRFGSRRLPQATSFLAPFTRCMPAASSGLSNPESAAS